MTTDNYRVLSYCCHYSEASKSVAIGVFHVPIVGCNLELYLCENCMAKLLAWCKMIEKNFPEPLGKDLCDD